MRLKQMVVAAGLAFGLMSGTVEAASFNYAVSFGYNDITEKGWVTGDVVTNVDSGPVTSSNIVSYDLMISVLRDAETSTARFTDANGFFQLDPDILSIVGDDLLFTDAGNLHSLIAGPSDETAVFQLFSGLTEAHAPGTFQAIVGDRSVSATFATGSTFLLGHLSPVSTAPSVPLPASAPLFGAALLALGLAGFAAQRKQKVA